MAEAHRLKDVLVQLGASKVWLFGSLARGDREPGDIDMMAIWETPLRFFDRIDAVYERVTPTVAVDLLIYTPAEFNELVTSRRFVQQAVKEGKLLYEKAV
ncbi:MAG: nucleotidyltransferase domain-containing protein [Peptococcaceae bacterium]|nr:nucleotidyltransferase domain-containing protein [Peptococcaceae bacterium]